MKEFKILGRNSLKETPITFSQPKLLRNLEIAAKEVTCRKKTYCCLCHRGIQPKERALKTIQYVKSLEKYHYNAYCDECYSLL